MKSTILLVCLFSGLLLFASACGKGGTDRKPIVSTTGEVIFNKNCSACHQKGGVGKVGLAPSIRNRDFLAIASDEFIRTTIKSGRPGTSMPSRSDLKNSEIDQIIAYLRSLPVANPIKVTVDWKKKISGNVSEGSKKFATFCAHCHGKKGEGYAAGGSGPAIGKKGFLDTASDDYIFQTLKYGRIGTPMKSFIGARGLANLTISDTHDIIAYLRSLNGK